MWPSNKLRLGHPRASPVTSPCTFSILLNGPRGRTSPNPLLAHLCNAPRTAAWHLHCCALTDRALPRLGRCILSAPLAAPICKPARLWPPVTNGQHRSTTPVNPPARDPSLGSGQSKPLTPAAARRALVSATPSGGPAAVWSSRPPALSQCAARQAHRIRGQPVAAPPQPNASRDTASSGSAAAPPLSMPPPSSPPPSPPPYSMAQRTTPRGLPLWGCGVSRRGAFWS